MCPDLWTYLQIFVDLRGEERRGEERSGVERRGEGKRGLMNVLFARHHFQLNKNGTKVTFWVFS